MIKFLRLPHVLQVAMLCAMTGGCAMNDANQASLASGSASSSKLTLAPLSYIAFCEEHGSDCRTSGAPKAVIPLTPENRTLLETVNRQVNERIRPTTAIGAWRIDPDIGNCNDYVVTKRHELLSRGLPASALLITVAQTPAGEDHLLLIVRTDQGELVLDNLTSDIRPRRQTNFVWVKRQRPSDPSTWEEL